MGRTDELPDAAHSADAFQALDQAATRDWVWHAVKRLSPSLQTVTLLRYFTGVRSYQHIASAGNAGEFAGVLRESWHPDAVVTWSDGRQVRGPRGGDVPASGQAAPGRGVPVATA